MNHTQQIQQTNIEPIYVEEQSDINAYFTSA